MLASNFKAIYKSFSVLTLEKIRNDVECGGKIILPQSALDTLIEHNIISPMLFKLTNQENQYTTHVGVLEFTALDGCCYLPNWLQEFLQLSHGNELKVEHASLPVATFARFQAIGLDFLDITNPKAVLENALRQFACLTIGDVIAIHYNNRIYKLRVRETLPEAAVSIIVCDMHVEFETPEGYVDPNDQQSDADLVGLNIIRSFEGEGKRLDGKIKKKKTGIITRGEVLERLSLLREKRLLQRGIPDYCSRPCELRFLRNVRTTPTVPATLPSPPSAMEANTSTTSRTLFPGTASTMQNSEVD